MNQASSESDFGNKLLLPAVPEKPRRERRLHRRFSCEAPATVRLVSSGIELMGNVRDLSLSGCSIEFEKKFPVGLHVRLEVLFSLQGLPLMLQGVSRCIHTPKCIGIEFLQVSARKKGEIAQIIAELEEKMEKQSVAEEMASGEIAEE